MALPLAFLATALPLYNLVEGLVDAARGQVRPSIGSILYCDLAFGYMDHSGVYIGDNEIVHLSGRGKIEVVSPQQFMKGGTARRIYVSCKSTWPVGSHLVAQTAISMIGSRRNYNFVLDNCHQFTSGCLTGNFENHYNFLWMLKDRTAEEIGADNWRFWDSDTY